MSIRDRLEDATVLFSVGRHEGAFVHVLIAAAATARKRYTRDQWDDSESFRNFIYDEMGIITGGPKYGVVFPFLGQRSPLEDILYHHLRCQLLHEGAMPDSVVFMEPSPVYGKNILHLGIPLGFPVGWIEQLATAVWLAPENDCLWPDEQEKRQKAKEGMRDLIHTESFCRRPGQQTKSMKNKNEKLSWMQDGIAVTVNYPPSVTCSQLAALLENKARQLRS
jgi:hypothetical protein